MGPRSDERGLTLIEVLVGLVLLSSFIGGIYTVAIGTMQARRMIQEVSAVYTAGSEILDLIEKDLRGAYFHGVKDMNAFAAKMDSVNGEKCTVIDLVTTTNSKNFVEVNDEFVRSDVTEVGYRMKESDDFAGFAELYRREQPFFDEDPLKGGEYYLVYDRVVSMYMEFFEKPDEESSTTSSASEESGDEEWDSADKKALPFAARITLVLGEPAEIQENPEQSEVRRKFVRWVLFPTAYDEEPKEDDAGPNGPGNPPR
ncbi:MAG: prepilin-type N-terminal cleavage/methylation domain-containing protein [Planctomycetota bacterium]